MSSRSSRSNASTWSPSSRAARSVAGEVATQRISSPRARQRGRAGRRRSSRSRAQPSSRPRPAPRRPRRRRASRARRSDPDGTAWNLCAASGPIDLASALRWRRSLSPRRPTSTTLCINTIRTLSIDAIQKANSGHPGTPMAMAPVAYTLWQRFLRFDPADPIWPNRDRFVLSAGHASMLLYSLLHLTRVQAVDPDYETLGEPVGQPRRHQVVPPARLAGGRPSRVPPDLRGRDDDRSARARASRRRVGMAIARQVADGATSAPSCSTSTST